MRCVYCNQMPEVFVIVPVKKLKLPGGEVESFACLGCAVKHGVYCSEHKSLHIGFDSDDSTVCLYCVEKDVQARKKDAPAMYERVKTDLPGEEVSKIENAAELASARTDNSKAVCILRFIATKARRQKISIDAVIEKLFATQSASVIL